MEISPYYEKQIDCIHCKKKFNTTKVRSKFIKISNNESDFHPIYENDVNPLFYNAFVCEHCGFSFTEDFSKYFAPGTYEAIDAQISAQWHKHSFGKERTLDDALQVYKLALVCGQIKKEKHITLAGLALRTAWLYRTIKNTEQEDRFIQIARDQYIDAYSNGDYNGTSMSEVRVLYLIAELSRRLGDREEAIRQFSRVIEKQRTSNEIKIIEMAKEQWQIMRHEKEMEEHSEVH
ncbi:DUF2225 domain-containing protein [Viridibacillus sp. YIM B01967]|uniref:DUF2225 domain-containing protein n=1 Tax=Viridibacillus soli TaxID=2798301 RepID=A0ABS1H9U3_9BACL|nr:DUF2225 domain-containing protein [Viridibacillus soli]MBK3496171.1 DUF2225 domain-containing protein [Viridibacillus soli]